MTALVHAERTDYRFFEDTDDRFFADKSIFPLPFFCGRRLPFFYGHPLQLGIPWNREMHAMALRKRAPSSVAFRVRRCIKFLYISLPLRVYVCPRVLSV